MGKWTVDLSHTEAVLADIQSRAERRDAMGQAMETREEVEAWIAAGLAEERLAQDAYHQDTKSINNLSGCRAMGLLDIQGMVKAWRRDTTEDPRAI